MKHILLLALLSPIFSFAQSGDTANVPYWIEMMQNPDVNFFKTQRAFEKYWENRPITKGSGYKPFKRWEWFMESEVNADGSYRDPATVEREFRKFDQKFNPQQSFGGNQVQSTNGLWTSLGPIQLPANGTGQPNGLGRLNCVGLHPTDSSVILVGAPNGGIWKSINHGNSWTSNSDTLVSMQISNLRFNPLNPDIVYAGTGDRDAGSRSARGVLKSTDGGTSWLTSNNGMGNRTVGMIIIHPNQPDTILAATSGGIFKSINAGSSWTRKSSNSNHYKDIVFMPNNPQIVYATEGGRFYRSSNTGETWTQITNGIPTGTRGVIAVSQDDSMAVYVLMAQGSVYKGTYRSLDGGLTFTTRSTTPNIMDWSHLGTGTGGQAWYDLDIAVDPFDKDVVYAAGVNIFKSTDGGQTWLIDAHWVGSGGADAVHADQHALEWSADRKRLYVANDGGLYFKEDSTSWIDLSSGIAISEIYKIGQAKNDEDIVINGYQDNGTAIYYGGSTWSTEIGGDGMECAIDPRNTDYVYGTIYYGRISRSVDGGTSFGTIAASGTNGITESGAWVTPFSIGEDNSDQMFIGYRNIWRSNNVRTPGNGNVSWTKISNNLGGTNSQTIRVVEQSPADPNIFYFARADRKLFRSDSIQGSNPNWVDLTSNLPFSSMPTDIEAHPFLDSVVYITLGSKVYKSSDLGNSWTDISANLPSLSWRTIVYDEYSSEGLYVGGTPGVYYRDSNTTNWVSFYDGLPTDVSVNELEIYYDTLQPALSKLRAGTYGRGLWSSDLYDDGTSLPIADFKASGTEACLNEYIDFSNRSAYNPNQFQWDIQPATYQLAAGHSLSDRNISVKFDSSTYYHIQLKVTNGNGTDSILKRNLIHIADSTTTSCYTTTNLGAGYGIGVQRVRISNLDHRSSGYDGTNSYHDFTCDGVAYLKPNKDYVVSVTVGSFNDENVEVYIDYNNDGDFSDADELVSNFSRGRTERLDTIRTKLNPRRNTFLRMRVLSDFSTLTGDPCKTLNYGESQDHLVYFDAPSLQISQDTNTVCAGNSMVFSATTDGRFDSLKWDFGLNAIPQSAYGVGPHTVIYPQAGLYLPTATLNGNIARSMFAYVRAFPEVSLSLDSSSSFCEGDFIELAANDSLGNSTVSFSWFKNGSNLNLSDSLVRINSLSLSDSGVYQVVTENFGCIDSSAQISVITYAQPSAQIGVNDSAQCLDVNDFQLQSLSTVSTGTLAYSWSLGDGTIDSLIGLSHQYQNAGTYFINLLVLGEGGCSDSVQISVNVHATPTATLSISDTALCELGNEFILENTSNVSGGSLTSSWNLGDGNSSGSDSLAHSYSTSGVYTIQLIVSSKNQCQDSILSHVEVYPQANAGFSVSNPNPAVYGFEPLDTNLFYYLWRFGDGDSSFLKKPMHTYQSNGSYPVQLKTNTEKNCADSSSTFVGVESVGLSALSWEGIEVFPNPSKGDFQLSGLSDSWKILSVTNNLGQEVPFEIEELSMESKKLHLNKTGIFFLHLQENNQPPVSVKLIVH